MKRLLGALAITAVVVGVGVIAYLAGAKADESTDSGQDTISDDEQRRLLDLCNSAESEASCLSLVDRMVTDAEYQGCGWESVLAVMNAAEDPEDTDSVDVVRSYSHCFPTAFNDSHP